MLKRPEASCSGHGKRLQAAQASLQTGAPCSDTAEATPTSCPAVAKRRHETL